MFEVAIVNIDGSKETYDVLTEIQAEFIFFRAKSNPNTDTVVLNELIDV